MASGGVWPLSRANPQLIANGCTNWDSALHAVAELNANENPNDHFDVVIFLTDGNPTAFHSPPLGLPSPSGFTRFREMETAVASANRVKSSGGQLTGTELDPDITQADFYRTADFDTRGRRGAARHVPARCLLGRPGRGPRAPGLRPTAARAHLRPRQGRDGPRRAGVLTRASLAAGDRMTIAVVVRVWSVSRTRNVRNTVRASAANADPAQATVVHRLRASRRAQRPVTG